MRNPLEGLVHLKPSENRTGPAGPVLITSAPSAQTLVADLKGDTHGDFEDLLVAMVTPPAVYDCREVIRAIKVSSGPVGADNRKRCRVNPQGV